MTECSQQRGNLKDDGYIQFVLLLVNYQIDGAVKVYLRPLREMTKIHFKK
ncbi:hypothetical protein ABLB90_01265 [Photorhabdus bodei]|uniref:Uncharacterized protein n=1 Tax=Photorhabdus kayaii TaxID=230088 RepID=A0ABX0AZL3_9GAMM|nr:MULTISPECIES: hypothetical protein [Photorhabdus]MCC8373002.1 hypothetical protein [Photorhabdus bodei]MDB6366340.1 hypothetical protein [Photorhabdus bodei]NDL13536.1 hypothetical protein [Photorhabdus kayaii]NDL26303.1 hypothetical protein [Photorhabdus kayaii]